MNYSSFIESKSQMGGNSGFAPLWMPDFLFDFQKALVEWSLNRGRGALFADTGLGKSAMQLVWAQNVVQHTNKPVLILTPLAVARQTIAEASKFGMEAMRSIDGSIPCPITVANYERMHHFNPADFSGVVCDESSILKNYSGATRTAIINFMDRTPYRLLCTATPSPNDLMELGNSVEALGVMKRKEMLSMYFTHDGGETSKWRLKNHAQTPFWRFVASWARAVRKPSDLGFDDTKFILPFLNMEQHTLKSAAVAGYLFPVAAIGLSEQRQERRETIEARCLKVAELAKKKDSQFLAWCSLNAESEMLRDLLPDCIELTGSQDDEEKADIIYNFGLGKIRSLTTKPDIAGMGVNWQSCHRMSFFPSHSHEQFYQSVRRCWRFGQKHDVDVHIVTTEAEQSVLENMRRKEAAATEMFSQITANMRGFYERTTSTYQPISKITIPSWLK